MTTGTGTSAVTPERARELLLGCDRTLSELERLLYVDPKAFCDAFRALELDSLKQLQAFEQLANALGSKRRVRPFLNSH